MSSFVDDPRLPLDPVQPQTIELERKFPQIASPTAPPPTLTAGTDQRGQAVNCAYRLAAATAALERHALTNGGKAAWWHIRAPACEYRSPARRVIVRPFLADTARARFLQFLVAERVSFDIVLVTRPSSMMTLIMASASAASVPG